MASVVVVLRVSPSPTLLGRVMSVCACTNATRVSVAWCALVVVAQTPADDFNWLEPGSVPADGTPVRCRFRVRYAHDDVRGPVLPGTLGRVTCAAHAMTVLPLLAAACTRVLGNADAGGRGSSCERWCDGASGLRRTTAGCDSRPGASVCALLWRRHVAARGW